MKNVVEIKFSVFLEIPVVTLLKQESKIVGNDLINKVVGVKCHLVVVTTVFFCVYLKF